MLLPEAVVNVVELAISITPEPEIEPIVSDTSTSKVAPELTETFVELFKVPVTLKVPAEIVVFPLYVFVPDSITIPSPVFSKLLLPLTAPLRVNCVPSTSTIEFPFRVISPANILVPVDVEIVPDESISSVVE